MFLQYNILPKVLLCLQQIYFFLFLLMVDPVDCLNTRRWRMIRKNEGEYRTPVAAADWCGDDCTFYGFSRPYFTFPHFWQCGFCRSTSSAVARFLPAWVTDRGPSSRASPVALYDTSLVKLSNVFSGNTLLRPRKARRRIRPSPPLPHGYGWEGKGYIATVTAILYTSWLLSAYWLAINLLMYLHPQYLTYMPTSKALPLICVNSYQ